MSTKKVITKAERGLELLEMGFEVAFKVGSLAICVLKVVDEFVECFSEKNKEN